MYDVNNNLNSDSLYNMQNNQNIDISKLENLNKYLSKLNKYTMQGGNFYKPIEIINLFSKINKKENQPINNNLNNNKINSNTFQPNSYSNK